MGIPVLFRSPALYPNRLALPTAVTHQSIELRAHSNYLYFVPKKALPGQGFMIKGQALVLLFKKPAFHNIILIP